MGCSSHDKCFSVSEVTDLLTVPLLKIYVTRNLHKSELSPPHLFIMTHPLIICFSIVVVHVQNIITITFDTQRKVKYI
jgi:hypothetical protein